MDSRLLVPATAALLDGWCGPMVFTCRGGPPVPGVMIAKTADGRHMCWSVQAGIEWMDVSDISLDLARAECRDRVARVLALGGTEVAWRRGWRDARPSWILSWRPVPSRRAAGLVEQAHCPPDLDWMDDTRLPDGSRRVDALALAAVAREALRG